MSKSGAKKRGKLTVIWGPMFSGKTNWLIEKFGNGVGSVVFKPDLDARYTKEPLVISHDQDEMPAVLVNHRAPSEMLAMTEGVKRVLIDEANFFSQSLVEVIETMLEQGTDVCVDGLMLDSERVVWGPVKELLEKSDEEIELAARCDGDEGKCSREASLSYRKTPNKEQVRVAGSDEYGACCTDHYQDLHRKYKAKK